MYDRVQVYVMGMPDRTGRLMRLHGVVVTDKVHRTGEDAGCYAAAMASGDGWRRLSQGNIRISMVQCMCEREKLWRGSASCHHRRQGTGGG